MAINESLLPIKSRTYKLTTTNPVNVGNFGDIIIIGYWLETSEGSNQYNTAPYDINFQLNPNRDLYIICNAAALIGRVLHYYYIEKMY